MDDFLKKNIILSGVVAVALAVFFLVGCEGIAPAGTSNNNSNNITTITIVGSQEGTIDIGFEMIVTASIVDGVYHYYGTALWSEYYKGANAAGFVYELMADDEVILATTKTSHTWEIASGSTHSYYVRMQYAPSEKSNSSSHTVTEQE